MNHSTLKLEVEAADLWRFSPVVSNKLTYLILYYSSPSAASLRPNALRPSLFSFLKDPEARSLMMNSNILSTLKRCMCLPKWQTHDRVLQVLPALRIPTRNSPFRLLTIQSCPCFFLSSSTGLGEEAVCFTLAKLQSQPESNRSLWTKSQRRRRT